MRGLLLLPLIALSASADETASTWPLAPRWLCDDAPQKPRIPPSAAPPLLDRIRDLLHAEGMRAEEVSQRKRGSLISVDSHHDEPDPTPSEVKLYRDRAERADWLTRREIVDGMSSIKPNVRCCYDAYKEPGLVRVMVNIGPAGDVREVRASGSNTLSKTTLSCVEGAVRMARFRAFGGKPMSLSYPFMIR